MSLSLQLSTPHVYVRHLTLKMVQATVTSSCQPCSRRDLCKHCQEHGRRTSSHPERVAASLQALRVYKHTQRPTPPQAPREPAGLPAASPPGPRSHSDCAAALPSPLSPAAGPASPSPGPRAGRAAAPPGAGGHLGGTSRRCLPDSPRPAAVPVKDTGSGEGRRAPVPPPPPASPPRRPLLPGRAAEAPQPSPPLLRLPCASASALSAARRGLLRQPPETGATATGAAF